MQFVVALVLVSAVVVHASKLPDYISACSVKDPELDDCILQQARIFAPEIVKGLKEFGLPTMDPMEIPLMQIDQSRGGSVDLALNITDSKHYGASNLNVEYVKADLKNHRFELFITNPQYSIVGEYVVKGRILVLPITGSGFANITIDNSNTTVVLDGKLEQRKGETYYKLTKVKCTFGFTKAHIRLDNLFGNKELSDSMNDFLNQNNKLVITEILPAIEEVSHEVYSLFLGRIFSKIPYNQLFKLE